MTEHTVRAFDEDLAFLTGRIQAMGALAERMVSSATEALIDRNVDLAQRVIADDPELDKLQREIEDFAIATIARRQPFAGDLREVVVALRITSDLERVGDLAKNIAKRTVEITPLYRLPRPVMGLQQMGDFATEQLRKVMDAYRTRTTAAAEEVWESDGELDAMEDSVFRDLLTFMMEEPRNIAFCPHLLFCAKNFERIGDHATNIAENVYYRVLGQNLPLERPRSAATPA
jgi:phosphate transport system protein